MGGGGFTRQDRESTAIHWESTAIHWESAAIHWESTAIHWKSTAIHWESAAIHHDPPRSTAIHRIPTEPSPWLSDSASPAWQPLPRGAPRARPIPGRLCDHRPETPSPLATVAFLLYRLDFVRPWRRSLPDRGELDAPGPGLRPRWLRRAGG